MLQIWGIAVLSGTGCALFAIIRSLIGVGSGEGLFAKKSLPGSSSNTLGIFCHRL